MAKKADLYQWGTGRRKTSVARVRIRDGSGKIVVNQTDCDKYFTTDAERMRVRAPLTAVEVKSSVDVLVTAEGGGYASQAGAISLGIARALIKRNPDYERLLREGRFLTRDSRVKERKKYGRAGARRSFQFSKR